MLRHLDLFSGIGGFSLGLESTSGFETVAFCEIEKFPRKILKKHWPHVKQYKDIKELTNEQLETDGIIPIDIITGGYPCQPFSVAGSQRGEKDKRHLWPEMFRLVKECRPTWVIGENVGGHIKLGLDTVLEDLESEGYSTRAFSISASSIGANHKRERVWILAHSERNDNFNKEQRVDGEKKEISGEYRKKDSDTRKPGGTSAVRKASDEYMEDTRRTLRQGSLFRTENENETGQEDADQFERSSSSSRSDVADTFSGNVETGRERQREIREGYTKERIPDNVASGNQVNKSSNTNGSGLQRLGSEHELREGQEERSFGWERWWELEPDVGRVANGVSKRMDRLKGLGNSLVPAIPYIIGQSILKEKL
jgi:DNA (cytosine-5)-methyltransferase 1